jgi:acyl-CoA synthetase (AMP-forming)/AMP-acid ligase II
VNIGQFLTQAARLYAGRAALTFENNTFSYAEFDRRVDALATAFTQLGLRRGDRVVLWSHNRPEVIETMFACWKRGFIVVPANASLAVNEVAFLVTDCAATALLHGPGFAPATAEVDVAHRIGFGGGYDVLLQQGAGGPREEVEVPDDAPAWLFYTSGTTGRPKGAMLTHANLTFMVTSWCADLHCVQPEDVVLHCAPLSHAAGFHALVAVARGAHAVVHERFQPAAVLDAVARHQITTTWLVPTQIRMLLDHPDVDSADLSTLTHVVYGGAPMHFADLAEALSRIGPVLVQLYGQGECPMTITYLRREEHRLDRDDPDVLTSTGVARTGMEVRIVDLYGATVPAGEIGEIVVRGPAVMAGYWNRREASGETIRNGWLHTGDIGRMDKSGFLYVLDRMKDLIITGGSNVYAREVEEVLLTHPAVHEAAAFGIPDRTWGELVTAAVVARADVTADELVEFCRARMSGFKRPRRVHVVAELPRNAYGKVLKRELREQFTTPDLQVQA